MPRVCVFDVNETLLDLGALDPRFEETFGDAAARKEWFAQLLSSWLTATVTGTYHNFGDLGLSALTMVAARRGVHEHLPFGEGEVDVPPLLAALAAVDFTGLVAVELPRHSHAAPLLAASSLHFLRDAERRATPDRAPQEVGRSRVLLRSACSSAGRGRGW